MAWQRSENRCPRGVVARVTVTRDVTNVTGKQEFGSVNNAILAIVTFCDMSQATRVMVTRVKVVPTVKQSLTVRISPFFP